jgi:hypothetical protein
MNGLGADLKLVVLGAHLFEQINRCRLPREEQDSAEGSCARISIGFDSGDACHNDVGDQ